MNNNKIHRVDFQIGCYNSDDEIVPGTEEYVCILFNIDVISVEEAKELVLNGRYSYDPRVAFMSQVQAEYLFGRDPRVTLAHLAGKAFEEKDEAVSEE